MAGNSTDLATFRGSCHCGALRFEVEAPRGATVWSCNCSICQKTGYLHLIVEKHRFRLLQGLERLTSYRFNTGVAEHLFCSVCGVKPFYVPRSHPNGYSVNVRCLEDASALGARVEPFDGQSWEQNVHVLERQPHDAVAGQTGEHAVAPGDAGQVPRRGREGFER